MTNFLIKALFYAIPTLFILFFALYTRAQIKDEEDGSLQWNLNDTEWHRQGLFMRIMFFVAMCGWAFPIKVQWVDTMLLIPILMIEWDTFINVARGRGVFDVGTGGWDAKIGKKKWYIYAIVLIAAIINYIIFV